MIEEKRIVYFCNYCKKMYKSKRWCAYHENLCYKKPNNLEACYDCFYLDEIQIYYDYYGSDRNLKVPFCKIKKSYLLNKYAKARNYEKIYSEQYSKYPTQSMAKENECKLFLSKRNNLNQIIKYEFDKKNKKFIVVQSPFENKDIILL